MNFKKLQKMMEPLLKYLLHFGEMQNKNILIRHQIKITKLKNVLMVNYFLKIVSNLKIYYLKRIGIKNLKIIGKFLNINQKRF